MTRWTHDEPGAGDLTPLRTAAVNVDYLADRLACASRDLSIEGATAEEPTLWAGLACDAWREERDELQRALAPVIGELEEYRTALAAYVVEVEDIDARGQQALAARTEAELELAAARRAAATQVPGVSLGSSTPRYLSGSGSGYGPLRATPEARIVWAQQEIADADKQLDELEQRREDADRAVLAALVPLPAGRWSDLGAVMAEAGFARPDQITETSLADAVTDALRAAFADGADLDGLRGLLAVWGDSPSVLGAALSDLGGNGLAALLHALDSRAVGDPAQAGAVARVQDALRDALAVGARAWDRATAEAFAAGLVGGPSGALVVGFLFADLEGAPMPAALTTAVADRVQAREQEQGGPFVWQVDPAAGGIGPMASGLTVPLAPPSPYRVVDPGAAVLRQLALHPAAALAWFADPAAGPGRVTHWYHDRDWAGGAGWAAPMVVWEALQGVPGALVGPGMDEALATRLATVNTGIINAFMTSDHRPTHGLGPEAAMALAGVLEKQLPIWLETVIVTGVSDDDATWGTDHVLWMGPDGSGPAVTMSKTLLRDLLTYTAEDPRASNRVLETAARLQVRLMQSVETSGLTHMELANRYAELLGAVDRARFTSELGAAQRADEQRQWAIDLGEQALGEVLGLASGPLGGLAAGVYGDAATDAWASRYAQALADFSAHTGPAEDRAAAARDLLGVMVDGWLPAEEIARLGGRAKVVDALVDDYTDERGW